RNSFMGASRIVVALLPREKGVLILWEEEIGGSAHEPGYRHRRKRRSVWLKSGPSILLARFCGRSTSRRGAKYGITSWVPADLRAYWQLRVTSCLSAAKEALWRWMRRLERISGTSMWGKLSATACVLRLRR